MIRIVGVHGHGTLTLSDATQFENRGLIQLTNVTTQGNSSDATLAATTGTLTNGPEGTIEILSGLGTGNRSIGATVVNQGTLRVVDYSFVIGNWTNTGVIDLVNSSFSVAGTLTNDGVVLVPAGSSFGIRSGATFHPSTGRFDSVVMGSGSVLGEGVNQDLITIHGSVTSNGSLTNAPSGVIRIVGVLGHGTLTLSDATQFANRGLIQLTNVTTQGHSSDATLAATTGTLTNGPEGTIEILSGLGTGNRSIGATVVNQGTLRVDHYSFVIGNWTNTGVIDLVNSSFSVAGTLTNDGVILVPAGSSFGIRGGATFHPSTGRFDSFVMGTGSVLGAGVNQDLITVHGSVTSSGPLINAPSGVIRIVGVLGLGAASLTLADATQFENRGLIQLTDGSSTNTSQKNATLAATTGTLTNGPEGTIEILRGVGAGLRTISAEVVNQGIIRLLDHSITLGQSLVNSGELQISRSQTLRTSGGLTQLSGGVVVIEVDGVNGAQSGRLDAGSQPTLAGNLNLVFAETSTYSDGATFAPVFFNTPTGQFDQIITTNLPGHISFAETYQASSLSLTALVTDPPMPLDPIPTNPFDTYRDQAASPPARPSVEGTITTTATPVDPTRDPIGEASHTATPSDPTRPPIAGHAHTATPSDSERDPIGDAFHTATPGDPTRDPIIVPALVAGTPFFTLARPTIRFSYDPVFNQLTNVIDALGHQTIYEIDPANGNTLTSLQVIGLPDSESGEDDDLVTSFTYTALGLLDTIIDPLGRVTDFEYDAWGRLTRTTYASGTDVEAFMTYSYDAAGNLSQLTDENGNVTTYTFDDLNRLVQITEPDPDGPQNPLTNPVTTFQYDARGNLIGTTDANGSTTSFVYDPLERRIRSVDDAGNITQYRYDAAGNLTESVDPLGNVTTNCFDERSRLIQTIDPTDGMTEFVYDAVDNLAVLTDPVGNATTFTYDSRHQVNAETDPLGNIIRYQYDLNGNVTQKTDRNERVTKFTYDDVDRLVNETWIAPDEAIVNEIVYAYDKVGNLTSVTDDFSGLEFTYDARDRVGSVDNALTPDAPHVVLGYTYDGVGNVTSVSDTIEGTPGATTSYQYDALNRQTQINQSGSGVSDKRVDFLYNALGQFASIDRFSDLLGTQPVVRTAYTYDDLNRLVDLRHSNAATDVAFYEYEYDSSSRITSINDIDGLTTYSYDARDQLIGADRSDGDVRGDESYTYDANGNRIESHLHGDGYVTGAANRLLSDGTYNYEYDNEGNMILRTEIATGDYRVFQWDHRNRLVSVSDFLTNGDPVQRVEFEYDAFGRRIAKSVDQTIGDAAAPSIVYFVYDRDHVLLDFVDEDGDSIVDPVLSVRYLHGPQIDQVLAQEVQPSNVEWILTDHLGSTRALVDVTGMISQRLDYDSFGDVIIEPGDGTGSRYLYTGREYDHELGVFYYRARYYDQSVGRFLSEDPLSFGAEDSNNYRYVQNDPISNVDPTGLKATTAQLEHELRFLRYDLQRYTERRDSLLRDLTRLGKRISTRLEAIAQVDALIENERDSKSNKKALCACKVIGIRVSRSVRSALGAAESCSEAFSDDNSRMDELIEIRGKLIEGLRDFYSRQQKLSQEEQGYLDDINSVEDRISVLEDVLD
ncbi:MAG: DUF4595 domain-containing protein [Planctomycetales bacterium]|nr:DUF4595 domain-containing protein [Planctomycetales bacterium]